MVRKFAGKSLNLLCHITVMARKSSPILFIVTSVVFLLVSFYGYRWISVTSAKTAKMRSRRKYDQRVRTELEHQKAWAQKHRDPLHMISTDNLKKWVRIWHDGIADKFTSYGELIQGIRPDGNKAKLGYEELIKRNQQDAILPFARLMEFGVPNDTSMIDRRTAFDLYRKHYANLTDLYERYDVLEAVERLSPPDVVNEISHFRSNIAGQMAALTRANRRTSRTHRPRDALTPPYAPGGQRLIAQRQTLQTDRQPENLVATQTVRDDRQNVHDTTVTKTVQTSVEKLRDSSDLSASSSFLPKIRVMIRDSDISEAKRDTANLALDTIVKNDQLHSATGMTETELLNLVWDRVHHQDNMQNQEALRENLVDELSACVENGATVCSTGRFTHILNTLNGVDDIVDIKPDWALSRELVDKAGVVYKDRLASLSSIDRNAINEINPNPDQEIRSAQFMEEVRKDIRDEFKRAYVIPGIMSQEKLDVELDKWIDHIG